MPNLKTSELIIGPFKSSSNDRCLVVVSGTVDIYVLIGNDKNDPNSFMFIETANQGFNRLFVNGLTLKLIPSQNSQYIF